MMGTMMGTRCAITPGPTARFGIGSWPPHFGAADVGILIVSTVFVSAIAVAVTPAKSRPLAPSEQSSVGAAEHPPARPGNAISGHCYVQGKWYPNGATVPLDPGPRSAMAAPIYLRCRQGMLCYDTVPTVCIRPGRLGR
jgi:hypothetical protein